MTERDTGAHRQPIRPGGAISLGGSYAQRACRLLEIVERANTSRERNEFTQNGVAVSYAILREDAHLDCRTVFEVGRIRHDALVDHLKAIHSRKFDPTSEEFGALLETRYELVGRALETIAWYDLRFMPGDRVLQALQRAEILLPGDRRIVSRYAELAQEATSSWPSLALAPELRERILLGHKNSCRTVIDDCLRDEFGIGTLQLKARAGVIRLLERRHKDDCATLGEERALSKSLEEKAFIFELIYASAILATQIASCPVSDFFTRKGKLTPLEGEQKRASLLNLAHGYSRTLLELLNLPPELEAARDDIREILDYNADVSAPFGTDTKAVLSVVFLLSQIMIDKSRFDTEEQYRVYHLNLGEEFGLLADEIFAKLQQGRADGD